MSAVTRTLHQSATLIVAGGTIGTTSAHRAFPSFVIAANGNAILHYRRGTSHVSEDGVICQRIGVPVGDGTFTWGSETVLWNTANDYRCSNIDITASGRLIALPTAQTSADGTQGTSSVKYDSWFSYSDDNGVTWSTPVSLIIAGGGMWDTAGSNTGPFGDDILEAADGSLLAACYGSPSGGGSWTPSYLDVARSTDDGATWSYLSRLSGPIGGYDPYETQLALLPNGNIYATFYTYDGVPTDYYHAISTDHGATWGTPVKTFASIGSNRAGLCVTPDGDLIRALANVSTGFQSVNQSWDGGVTFSGWVSSGAATAWSVWISPESIGSVATTPNLAVAVSVENSSQNQASIYWATYTRGLTSAPAAGYGNTVSAGYGAATAEAAAGSLLVLPASSAWEQVATSIFVRTVNEPCTVEATITGTAGGLLRFAGADADLFDASLDGTTWASMVDVPPGTSTVHLRVTPEAPGTTLSAEIGVPV